jgi:predicted GNAT family N-acyltransferase
MKTFQQFLFESEEALNKISSAWERKHPGMKFHVYQNRSGDIRLDQFEVPKNKRGQGIGGRALRGLSKYASKNKKRITLTPQAERGYKKKLDTFYRSYGFKPNSGRNKDYSVSDTMIRNPN